MTQPSGPVYRVLSQNERDDMLTETLLAQERDAFAHHMNLERFDAIIADEATSPEFRERIEGLRADTSSRIAEVDVIIRSLTPQLPTAERLAAAKTRIDARAEASQTTGV